MPDPDRTRSFPSSSSGPLRAPPLAAGLPLVGALPAVLRERLDFFATAREKYGDIFEVKLGPTKIVALTHPRYAQHVLRDHAKNYWKGGGLWEAFRTLLGNGIPVSDGDYWRRHPRAHRAAISRLRRLGTDRFGPAVDDTEVERRDLGTSTESQIRLLCAEHALKALNIES